MESTHSNETQEKAEHLDCPRCGSRNTKFCYYNNYNKSQPRHFCKGCRRHWTKGGILRNVPLGNIRKNKRQKKRSNSAIFTNTSCIISQDEQGSAAKDQTRAVSDALFDSILGSSDDKKDVFSSATPLKSADQSSQDLSILELNDQSSSDAYHYILSQPWQNPTTSGAMDTSNLFWDWNEIDSLVSADLDIPLDETEITF